MLGITTSLLIFTRFLSGASSLNVHRRFGDAVKLADRVGMKYRVRPAVPDDIPRIHQCNLESLPENYNSIFYLHHITRWPELSLIAETEERDLMGYALGRIEAAPINQLPFEPMQPPRYIGHVASIAVYNHYRGNGIGTALITKLHEEFGQTFQLDEVSLYCRGSNVAALTMYSKLFNYRCDKIIPNYYDDNEDAHYMIMKGLQKVHDSNHQYSPPSSTI